MSDITIMILIFVCFFFIAIVLKYFLDHYDEDEKNNNTLEANEIISLPPKDILSTSSFKKMITEYENNQLLELPIGFNEKEKIEIIDLNKTNNLLLIGTTGGGKSILLDEIISSIAMLKKSNETKITTIDTSIVELSHFNSIPHYVKDTIISPLDITIEIDELLKEQNRRKTKKDNIPLIIIIDDLYDICDIDKQLLPKLVKMLENGKETNMYFILSTDTPSKDIITKDILELITGTIYLTLSPGSKKFFELNLTKKEIDFISTIGNAILINENTKKKIIIPEVVEEDIEKIKNSLTK